MRRDWGRSPDLRLLQLDMVLDLDVVLALPYEDLDESSHFLLRGLVGHQTPALDDFGYGVTQAFQRGLVVQANEHHDLCDCSCDACADRNFILLQLFGNLSRVCLELFKSQDCLERMAAVRKRDKIAEAECLDDSGLGDPIPDETAVC